MREIDFPIPNMGPHPGEGYIGGWTRKGGEVRWTVDIIIYDRFFENAQNHNRTGPISPAATAGVGLRRTNRARITFPSLPS